MPIWHEGAALPDEAELSQVAQISPAQSPESSYVDADNTANDLSDELMGFGFDNDEDNSESDDSDVLLSDGTSSDDDEP